MRGVDFSHYQLEKTFNDALKIYDFMIHKASEGKSMKDKTLLLRLTRLKTLQYRGYYHYAHPELNTVQSELDNFKNAMGSEYYEPGVLLALDWEGKALNCGIQWALDFCNTVYAETGKHCLIYAQQSYAKRMYGEYPYWWVAHYTNVDKDGCKHLPFKEVMVQYTSKPYDMDFFTGTVTWEFLTGKKGENKNEYTTMAQWQGSDKKIYKVIRVD